MSVALSVLCVLPVAAGWRWHYLVHRTRWRKLEEALDRLSGKVEEGDPEAAGMLSKDVALETVKNRIERLAGLQASMKQRIEHEEFSLRTVLSCMEDGVLVADERQTIRLLNPAFVRTFGISGSGVGRTVLEVLGEPEIYRLLQGVMEKGGGRQQQIEMVPGKRVRHVLVHAMPMRDLRGRSGVVAVFRDVTRLEELENVRREFVANVSHELRTPLAVFQGYVENLLEMPDLPEEDRTQVLGILQKHSNRLNILVEDLLSLARLEARREDFYWEVRDLGEWIQEVVRDWTVRCKGRDLKVGVEVEDGLSMVRMDSLRMEQVVHNLLENARKHVPSKGGEVRVLVRGRCEAIEVSVEDNGSGIPPRDLPHIFERFYRANKARTHQEDGAYSSGLGLSIVKHIVVSHGGEVGAASPSGRGARVWFTIPNVTGAADGASGEARAARA